MPVSRTPEHDVAKRINVLITRDDGLNWRNDSLLEEHLHVGADLRTQTNEEAGRWIKAIIDRVVRKELE